MFNAEPGMVVATDVRHPRHHHIILLRPGAILDEHSIAHLREIRVREVFIRYPSLESLGAIHSTHVSNMGREVSTRLGKAMDDFIADRHCKLDYNVFRNAITDMLTALSENPKAALYMMELSEAGSAHVRHASNTAFLSMLLGMKLDFYLIRERGRLTPTFAQDITALGVGAMLHDIGMTLLDEDVQRRYEDSGDQEDPAWREHVRLGFTHLRNEFDACVGAIALHHHQRFDGSGFPLRAMLDGRMSTVAGSEIHIFARIVAVADQLDRLRFPGHTILSPPRGEPAMPVVRALKTMISSPMCDCFDPVILRTLLAVVPPFAPGTLVTLSDGRRAIVSAWTPLDPCRPTVEVLTESSTKWWENPPVERINLREKRELSIAKAEGVDVSQDLFLPASEREFDAYKSSGRLKLAA